MNDSGNSLPVLYFFFGPLNLYIFQANLFFTNISRFDLVANKPPRITANTY